MKGTKGLGVRDFKLQSRPPMQIQNSIGGQPVAMGTIVHLNWSMSHNPIS